MVEKITFFAHFPTFAGMKLWQHRTMGAVDFSGSFAPKRSTASVQSMDFKEL